MTDETITAPAEVKVHHAVAKKAAKHNVALRQVEGGFEAGHADLTQTQLGTTPAEALAAALKALGYGKPKRVRQPGAPKVAAKTKTKKTKKDKVAKAGLVSNKSVVKKSYKDFYKTRGSGQGNGDRLDIAMRDALEADDNALSKIARENGVQFNWTALNKGLQRMNLTNVLRGRIDRGEKISVLGKTIASL